ncbi:MAG TPA: YacL family protein [Thermoanaerobaculia bacterium]|nr:YacL family protein [Thermoanaerobaculia bacterium]
MQVMHFYRDEAGDPRANSPEPQELLARFLESDIQGSEDYARDILGAIERVEAGKEPSWQETGNAHTLILDSAGATIEAEYEEDGEAPPCRVSLDDLRAALIGWLAFLERTSREDR